MTDSEPPLNFENFPCMCDPDTRAQMQDAKPCPRCGSTNLTPVSDCDTPPTIAIACDDCGEIEGDAATLREALTNWNRLPPVDDNPPTEPAVSPDAAEPPEGWDDEQRH